MNMCYIMIEKYIYIYMRYDDIRHLYNACTAYIILISFILSTHTQNNESYILINHIIITLKLNQIILHQNHHHQNQKIDHHHHHHPQTQLLILFAMDHRYHHFLHLNRQTMNFFSMQI